MPLYLGIDAGGTKTESAVSNGAALLGQATCGSSKISRVGEDVARCNLREAILTSCAEAAISPEAIDEVCLGMSGASLPATVEWARGVIRELVPGAIQVTGDHIIAHRAAFGTMAGVLVLAGTGSFAYGRNEHGESARAGGWGAAISDEGSAFWLGREAVSTALHEYDRTKSNGLLTVIAKRWNAATATDVARLANADQGRFTELAVPVAEAAERGDAAAQAITTRAGRELAGLAGAVIARLWTPDQVARVAMAGGVLQGSGRVRRAFQEAIQAGHPNAVLSFAYVRPVLGALELAQQGALK